MFRVKNSLFGSIANLSLTNYSKFYTSSAPARDAAWAWLARSVAVPTCMPGWGYTSCPLQPFPVKSTGTAVSGHRIRRQQCGFLLMITIAHSRVPDTAVSPDPTSDWSQSLLFESDKYLIRFTVIWSIPSINFFSVALPVGFLRKFCQTRVIAFSCCLSASYLVACGPILREVASSGRSKSCVLFQLGQNHTKQNVIFLFCLNKPHEKAREDTLTHRTS